MLQAAIVFHAQINPRTNAYMNIIANTINRMVLNGELFHHFGFLFSIGSMMINGYVIVIPLCCKHLGEGNVFGLLARFVKGEGGMCYEV